MKPESSWL